MTDRTGNGVAAGAPAEATSTGGQRWFAGVPVTSERRLTEEERTRLAVFLQEIAVAVARTYGWFLALIVWIVVSQFFQFPFALRWSPILIFLMFIARGGGMRAAAMAHWLLDVRADERDPVVLAGSGPVAESFISVRTINGPTQLTVFHDEVTLTVEVLPRSGMLWTYNGRPTVQPMFVARSRTSEAPQHARMAANFVKPVEGVAGVFSHQRPLDENEREELRSYVTAVSPLRLGIALAMLLSGAGLIAAALRPLDLIVMIGGAGLLLIGIARLFDLTSRMRLLRQLRHDERESVAVIVREGQEGELSAPIEFLPYSRRIWTKDGAPALWRKISARR